MRDLLLQGLTWVNRLLKSALGIRPPREATPPPPLYFDRACWTPNRTDPVRKGAWLFLLEHPARGSGGLHDILHLGVELERQYGLDVWYACVGGQALEEVRDVLAWTHPGIDRERIQDRLPFAPEFVCATSWPTAYVANTWPSRRKMYFVQDFEPWFYSAGVSRYYAEKTYTLGLEMFTLGPWLAQHLREHFGIRDCCPMPFPVSDEPQAGLPWSERRTVALYLQTDKRHRGAELILEGARRLSRRLAISHPDLRLELFGSADNVYLQPEFPCTVHGVLAAEPMARLMAGSRLAICSSFTNVSLLTLRFPLHGCPVMDLDLPSVRQNVAQAAAPLIGLYPPDPEALVEGALALLQADPPEATRRQVAERLARDHSWAACARSLKPLFAGRETNS